MIFVLVHICTHTPLSECRRVCKKTSALVRIGRLHTHELMSKGFVRKPWKCSSTIHRSLVGWNNKLDIRHGGRATTYLIRVCCQGHDIRITVRLWVTRYDCLGLVPVHDRHLPTGILACGLARIRRNVPTCRSISIRSYRVFLAALTACCPSEHTSISL